MNKIDIKHIIFTIILVLAVSAALFFGFYRDVDLSIGDLIFDNNLDVPKHIVLVEVDDQTIGEYGDYSSWSRKKIADTLEFLTEDESNAPAVIGVAFVLLNPRGDATDDKLLDLADRYHQFVYAADPFEKLASKVNCGYSGYYFFDDTNVRYTSCREQTDGEMSNSFAYEVYRTYAEKMNLPLYVPEADNNGLFRFFYTNPAKFFHVSMNDLLSGKAPKDLFKDSIVLVGATASGIGDYYDVAVTKEKQMSGVEIQATIINSYLNERTAKDAPELIMTIITAAVLALFLLLVPKQKIGFILIESVGIGIIYVLVACFLCGRGIIIPMYYLLLGLVVSDIYFAIRKLPKSKEKAVE